MGVKGERRRFGRQADSEAIRISLGGRREIDVAGSRAIHAKFLGRDECEFSSNPGQTLRDPGTWPPTSIASTTTGLVARSVEELAAFRTRFGGSKLDPVCTRGPLKGPDGTDVEQRLDSYRMSSSR